MRTSILVGERIGFRRLVEKEKPPLETFRVMLIDGFIVLL